MLKIGICDDEQIVRDILRKKVEVCLNEAGVQAEIIFFQQGLDLLETGEDIDILFLDIEMPEMDGHRLTKLVKSDDATKNIPIIIFSSLVNDDMKRKGEALGADAQLSKPEIGNLVKIVDELVAEKHLDR